MATAVGHLDGHQAVAARYRDVDPVYAETRDLRLLGFVLFLLSDCVLFSAFIFAYVYLRTSAPAWPPFLGGHQLPWFDTSFAAFKMSKKREFVQEWKMADLEPALDEVSQGRNFANGKAAFHDAQCMLCHRFGNEGGSIGPELTAVSSKYGRREILESIIEPSKVISDQFQNITPARSISA